jgi:D-alanine-D-alanine ligase
MIQKVILLINKLSEHPTPDELDVLDQAGAVEASLDDLHIHHVRLFVDLNLETVVRRFQLEKDVVAFNLVESLNNNGGLVYVVPALLESMQVPFTGNPSDALFLTTQKPLAKKILAGKGIPTPAWFNAGDPFNLDPDKTYMVKPSREDASVGINDENVFSGRNPQILDKFRKKWGSHFFVEEFITGREFNLSVVGGPDGPEVLWPAEILFKDFPEGKPTIVGYAAKWDEDTFEYRNTVRTFEFPESDNPLLESLKTLCHDCWRAFNLRGYVRVDFRVDQQNQPYVLEINANPCISPDSGFYNAALRSGYTFTQMIERILNDL